MGQEHTLALSKGPPITGKQDPYQTQTATLATRHRIARSALDLKEVAVLVVGSNRRDGRIQVPIHTSFLGSRRVIYNLECKASAALLSLFSLGDVSKDQARNRLLALLRLGKIDLDGRALDGNTREAITAIQIGVKSDILE